ncbi:MAG TPA: type II secretion system minor pseudopilin GspH [Moraxellaceae bacterium]|nr:type II secretion system minor pseudopilin GspH [Moraxellaceae bacterium]
MPASRPARGFTLLEVLMVVLLVGIISSVVVVSVNTSGPERALPEEAQRLAALLEQAGNEAVMQNREYGLRVTPEGYTFLCLNEEKQRWGACPEDIFRERQLPEGLELLIEKPGSLKELPSMAGQNDLAASTAARQRQADESNGKDRQTPDVFLLSSGESSAASLQIRVTDSPDVHSDIIVDEVGRVRIEGLGNDEAKQGGSDGGPG